MKIQDEKGQALLIAMIAICIGAIVLPTFLGHASASLIGSRNYRNAIDAQYACDSGAEHAIWRLTEGGLAASIPNRGDTVSYNLTESINGLTTGVKVSNSWETIAWDDFNSGVWTGGGGWLGGWSNSGASAVTTSGTPYEGTYHLRLQNSTGIVSRSVDLSKQVNAYLRFWAKVDAFESGDAAICRISQDGNNWTTIYTWTDSDDDSTYHYHEINLTTYGLTDTFWISFQANMDAAGDYFYVDDLDIVWMATAPKIVASDNFESADWGGGEGWSGNWTNTGSSSITTLYSPHSGSYHLWLQSGSGYVKREVDLSDETVVRLQFWAGKNTWNGTDNAQLLISSDGTAWQSVYTFSKSLPNSYQFYNIDLSSYDLTDTFWIAFDANMNQSSEHFYIDDITINASNAFCITATAEGHPLKVAIDLLWGIKNVLCWYY